MDERNKERERERERERVGYCGDGVIMILKGKAVGPGREGSGF